MASPTRSLVSLAGLLAAIWGEHCRCRTEEQKLTNRRTVAILPKILNRLEREAPNLSKDLLEHRAKCEARSLSGDAIRMKALKKFGPKRATDPCGWESMKQELAKLGLPISALDNLASRIRLDALGDSETRLLRKLKEIETDGGAEQIWAWFATEFRDVADGIRAEVTRQPNRRCTHSSDFTSVNWYGTEYFFTLGVQSGAIKSLWEEWETTGLGLHQETICGAIDPERLNGSKFRMDKAFRAHPAFGTMICRNGDGRYRLAEPKQQKTARRRNQKKSRRIPPRVRQKPR